MKKTLNHGFTAALIVASAAGLLATIGWNSTTALFPRAVCIPTLLLAVAILLRDIRAERRTPAQARAADAATEAAVPYGAVALRFAWLVGFLSVIWALGLVAAIFLFVMAYMARLGGYGWGRSFVFAALTACAVYLVFNVAFEVVWPQGALTAMWM